MGKRIISRRRGRGTSTYKSPSFRFYGSLNFRSYDETERKESVKGKIIDLIKCPGHSAPLAIIRYDNKGEALISAPTNVRVNDTVYSGNAEVKDGNVLTLKNIPEGTLIFNIESSPGSGPKYCRAAGGAARILAHSGEKTLVKLPSKKDILLDNKCRAVIGFIAASGRKEKPFVKAGKMYHAMKARNKLYPITSGVAMNAVDHPFGSGRGRHKGKPRTPPRNAPPGRNVGEIRARRTGKRK